MATTAPAEALDKEALIKRNPHRDFPAVEASRPDYDHAASWSASKTPNPKWGPGDGANGPKTNWDGPLVHIDPQEPGRTTVQNYKMMISTTVPRPIALVSTVTKDGTSTNLAPFSYFQNVTEDPPLYSLSFACKGDTVIDSFQNLVDTGECCISLIGDWFIECVSLLVYLLSH
jgi:hypothetical protein